MLLLLMFIIIIVYEKEKQSCLCSDQLEERVHFLVHKQKGVLLSLNKVRMHESQQPSVSLAFECKLGCPDVTWKHF